MEKWENQKTRDLYKAILALKTAGEARRFLRDLLTEDELMELGNRWLAARLLAEKETYKAIQEKTGLSERTIARIAKWLKQGMGGYKLMINRFNHHNSSDFKKG